MTGPAGSDVLARMGGDEFCVLVTDPTASPHRLKEQLVDAIRLFNEAEVRPYRLSASIGVMLVTPENTSTVDEC